MRVELFPPESVTEPRLWVRHDQAFAMMLGPGSIEWGSRRSAMEQFHYAAGDLALCDRHHGEWVGLMNTPHLQIGISDTALLTAADGADSEVELCPQRKFADPRLGALVAAVHTEIPDHSRPARRFIVAAAYSGRFKLWGLGSFAAHSLTPGAISYLYGLDKVPLFLLAPMYRLF